MKNKFLQKYMITQASGPKAWLSLSVVWVRQLGVASPLIHMTGNALVTPWSARVCGWIVLTLLLSLQGEVKIFKCSWF